MNEKKERFSRLFPKRVETLIDKLKILENCSNKSSYEWTEDLVQKCWIEIGKRLQTTAKSFGVEMIIHVNGKNVREIDTSVKKKRTPRKKKKSWTMTKKEYQLENYGVKLTPEVQKRLDLEYERFLRREEQRPTRR